MGQDGGGDDKDNYGELTSATSFWKVRVRRVRPNAKGPLRVEMHSSHLMMSGVDTLKGRFPMMCKSGGSADETER